MKRCCLFAIAFLPLTSPALAIQFSVTNLVTDDQSVNSAQITDPTLKNGWGISMTATSPFWVSANGSGIADIYRVNPTAGTVAKVSVNAFIPGDGSVTGQVSNSNSAAFNGDVFLFGSEDGTISGWRSALSGGTAEVLVPASSANVYKGVTDASIFGNVYLYAANFRAGTIDVLKGTVAAPSLTGNFTDPNIPTGYAPFNIQNLGGNLFVTYALQDAAKHDDQAGPGRGFVDEFDTQGDLIGRVASQGSLNSPWGLALAPASFGPFAGDLLVGNFGDGTINAFTLGPASFAGQLNGTNGQPLMIDGLWGLAVGNGGGAGNSSTLYFSAGPNSESNGLFGAIAPVPEPATLALLAASAAMLLVGVWRRRTIHRMAT